MAGDHELVGRDHMLAPEKRAHDQLIGRIVTANQLNHHISVAIDDLPRIATEQMPEWQAIDAMEITDRDSGDLKPFRISAQGLKNTIPNHAQPQQSNLPSPAGELRRVGAVTAICAQQIQLRESGA